jgi:hypothetical protein
LETWRKVRSDCNVMGGASVNERNASLFVWGFIRVGTCESLSLGLLLALIPFENGESGCYLFGFLSVKSSLNEYVYDP